MKNQSEQRTKSRYDEVIDLFLEEEIIGKNGWHRTKETNKPSVDYLRKKLEASINSTKEEHKLPQVESIGRR